MSQMTYPETAPTGKLTKRDSLYYQNLYQRQRDEAISAKNLAEFYLERFNRTCSQGQTVLAYGHVSHIEMADQMRMMHRNSQAFEGIVSGARDRIYWLAAINTQKDTQIAALRAALEELSPGKADEILKANPTVQEATLEKLAEQRNKFESDGSVVSAAIHARRVNDPLGTGDLMGLIADMRLKERESATKGQWLKD